jgi:hypothetical protein
MKKICLLSIILISFKVIAQLPTDSLVAYYPFNGNAHDESLTHNHASILQASLGMDRFGVAGRCYVFNGLDQYIEFPDHDSLSIATTGKLTISIWMRPDTLNFVNYEGDGYVHWMGKGTSGEQEWLMRMYNLASARPNRTSCYAFNLSGGLGSGSYVEETLSQGTWIHLSALYDYPANLIQIYKNGVLRDTDHFTDYSVIPGNGTAPFRIGTRDFNSYFKGAIDDIRIYSRILSPSEIKALYKETNSVTSVAPIQQSKIQVYVNAMNVLEFDSGSDQNNSFSLIVYNSIGQIFEKKNISSRFDTIKLNGKSESYFVIVTDQQSGKDYSFKIKGN